MRSSIVDTLPGWGRVRRDPSRYRQLSDDELFAIVGELPQRPLLAGEKGVRLSLAGAQKKLPVFHDGGPFSLGYGSCPSNQIIKPAIDNPTTWTAASRTKHSA